jgi:hypothetical protein
MAIGQQVKGPRGHPGESESSPVMGEIGVGTSPYSKERRLPFGVSVRDGLCKSRPERRTLTADKAASLLRRADALSSTLLDWQNSKQGVRRLQIATVQVGGDALHRVFDEKALEMLEPDAGKLASPVLRGLGASNSPWLPGRRNVIF